MSLKTVTIALSVLFAVGLPVWDAISNFVKRSNNLPSESLNLEFLLILFLFFSSPYMVTALIAIPMKKTASLAILLCHTLGFHFFAHLCRRGRHNW